MADLGSLADQGTPLMTSLGQSASALGRQFANLTPFASKARTALIELGASARESQPDAGRDAAAGAAPGQARLVGGAVGEPAGAADGEHRADRTGSSS